jgi:chromosome segregation ATPase
MFLATPHRSPPLKVGADYVVTMISLLTSRLDQSESVFSRDLQGFKLDMEAKMDTMQKILTILHDELEKETADRKIFQKDHDRTVMDLTRVKGRVGALERPLKSLDDKVDDLDAKVSDMTKQLHSTRGNAAPSANIAGLTQQLKELKDELAGMKRGLVTQSGLEAGTVVKLGDGAGTPDSTIANAMVRNPPPTRVL